MREKIKVPFPIIVEGKYDKAKLSEVVEGHIITTNGFGIFSKKETLALIKRLSIEGVVVLTDSDGAGNVIRSYIKSALPADKIYNLYIPRIEGKEKRKREASKEGTLGVEGMEAELLYEMFRGLVEKTGEGFVSRGGITKADFYEVGMTGSEVSLARRNAIAKEYGLPPDMTPNSLLGALNLLTDKNDFFKTAERVFYEDDKEFV